MNIRIQHWHVFIRLMWCMIFLADVVKRKKCPIHFCHLRRQSTFECIISNKTERQHRTFTGIIMLNKKKHLNRNFEEKTLYSLQLKTITQMTLDINIRGVWIDKHKYLHDLPRQEHRKHRRYHFICQKLTLTK